MESSSHRKANSNSVQSAASDSRERIHPEWLINLPNYITFALLALLYQPPGAAWWVALAVFIAAGLSDVVDGFIARKYGAVSDLGKLLDPLVDKLMVLSALVMLVARDNFSDGHEWVPASLVILILGRELWVTGLRGLAASQGLVIAADSIGKLKSGLQIFAVGFLLPPIVQIPLIGVTVSSRLVGLNLLLLSAFVGWWGAYHYTRRVLGAREGPR